MSTITERERERENYSLKAKEEEEAGLRIMKRRIRGVEKDFKNKYV